MSENRTMSLRLPLDRFTYGPDKSKVGWRAVDHHSGQKVVIFDQKVAEAIENGGEQSRDYSLTAPKEAGRDWVVAGIPGVYEPPPRFGGGGGARPSGGGGMSHKQVALLAAATLVAPIGFKGRQLTDVTIQVAGELLVYLAGGGTPAPVQAAPAPALVVVPDDPAQAASAMLDGWGEE